MVKYILRMIVTVVLFSIGALAQTTWEFSGTSYAFQKAHFDSATNVVKSKLGVQMRTFGAPYNQIDATLLQVMSEDPNYRVLLLGQLSPSPATGQINLTNRVFIESATGVPDYNYFLSSWYSKKSLYTDYMVMQGHPFDWTTPAKMTEFSNILNYLVATDSVVFNTPYGYYRYLNDLTIPRTSKIQVILKLDDLRAASYFYPSLPTYDTLVAKKIKAGFGVNKMETLSQAQIDTLQYYLRQTTAAGDTLFELWNHGLDHSQTVVTAGGNWSDPSIWPGNMIPTAADDVTIPAGTTITIDIPDAVCGDLTVNGSLVALNSDTVGLTVYGNVLINSGGSFTSPSLTGGTANIFHALTVHGNFTNTGGTFDFRGGTAGTTMRAINTSFVGSTNSTITVGTYSSSNNDFNGITVNKTGGAKVVCGSDVVCDPGSSAGKSLLTLTSGLVETGNFAIFALSTTAADVTASSTSYVNGALGRGMSNSGGKSSAFQVGDSFGYRPITITSTTAGVATGHYVLVRCLNGNANTGSTLYAGGIGSVSNVRYYRISYSKGTGATAPDTMSFNLFSPSYGTDDGVIAGNTELRVAYSTNSRATWNGMSQTTPHTTSLTSLPRTITPTALTPALKLSTPNEYIYCALARTSITNPLPVELTSFTAAVKGKGVELRWSTATEVNNYGFEIEKISKSQTHKFSNLSWQKIGFIPGNGTTNAPKEYVFTDNDVRTGRFVFRLKQLDRDGNFTYSPEVHAGPVPDMFQLLQNYPNPFNPVTMIRYQLPMNTHVSLIVSDAIGREVAKLVHGIQNAGTYAIMFNAAGLSSGVYFYTLRTDSYVENRKMNVLK